jgi:peroxiredoxin
MKKVVVFISVLAIVAMALATRVTAGGQKSASSSGVKPGDLAPQFALQDQDGRTVNLADFKGKIIVLEWFNNECPYVQRHYKAKTMSTLADKFKSQDVVWLAINSTKTKTNADNKSIAEQWSIGYPILNDSDGAVGHAYGAKNTPHMFIIDKDGKVAYVGGIDNDPEGEKGDKRINYVEKALDELTAGKPVSEPRTLQYGCTVKYAS